MNPEQIISVFPKQHDYFSKTVTVDVSLIRFAQQNYFVRLEKHCGYG